MLLIHGVRLPLGAAAQEAFPAAQKKAGIGQNAVAEMALHKVSVDARRRPPLLVYSVALRLKDEREEARFENRGPDIQIATAPPFDVAPGAQPLPGPVVVCGLGPAGLFAALQLAAAGYAPLVLERGPAMEERRKAVDAFEVGGALNENANIQFGEGGAGTFSDGKLATRIKDPLCARVTQLLLEAGAPKEIAVQSRPHIGTDLLRDVFVSLRRRAEALGAKVLFNTQLTALAAGKGRLCGVRAGGRDIPCGALVLACGHSARDTFLALNAAGVQLDAKPFSVGLRAEHPQTAIDEGLYHGAAGHPALPVGEYRLSGQYAGRGVYTFCMCPGGSVVAAASQAGGVVTNGMSLHARSGPNANAAVVAGVGPEDFDGDPFKAIAFQRELEQAAFASGGDDYTAPAQTLDSFLAGTAALNLSRVQPTYPRGVRAANLGALLPADITEALKAGMAAFGRKLPGYAAADTLLTGLETRTSSPVRIVRGESLESLSMPGLYPCGEGAGYAGGIMSAAVDGIRAASAIIGRYAAP